jgi:hypothetical protein
MSVSDLAPTVDKIAELARRAHAVGQLVEFRDDPADPERYTLTVRRDSEGKVNVDRHAKAALVRSDSLAHLDDAVRLVELLAKPAEEEGDDTSKPVAAPRRPVVWFSSNGVVVVHDERDQRDRSTYFWRPTPVLVFLRSLGMAGKEYAQKEFIALLRTVLWDALRTASSPTRAEMLASIRHVKTSTRGTTESVSTVGRQSLGKSLETEISGAQPWNLEEFVLRDPLWFGLPSNLLFDVRVAIETTFEGAPRFCLLAVEIEPVLEAARDIVRLELDELLPTDVPLLRGEPTELPSE